MTWPKSGRCGACLQPAEQYPSGRWRHTIRPCPGRSATLTRVGDLPLPPVEFVPDGNPLPQPGPHWLTTVEYDGDIPARMGLHSPDAVARYWDTVRAALAERTATHAIPKES